MEAIAAAIYGDGPLHYGDGSIVDAANAQEVATFRRFVAAHRVAPGSRQALKAFYLGQVSDGRQVVGSS